MINRRRHRRVMEYTSISYRLFSSPKPEHFLTRDISESGVRFLSYEFIIKDTILELTLNLTKIPFSFQTQAVVKWIRKDSTGERYEVGAEFLNIPQKAYQILVDYIATIPAED